MTIESWYFTFGFKVKKDAYLKIRGYTMENIPKEYLKDGMTDDELKDIFNEWILECCPGFALQDKFSIDGIDFIGRGFTHESEFEDYVVVGIDMGQIDRWEATREMNTRDVKEEIVALTGKQEWITAIQNAGHNTTFFSKVPYGVEDPKYESYSICPSVHITADDCDCCS